MIGNMDAGWEGSQGRADDGPPLSENFPRDLLHPIRMSIGYLYPHSCVNLSDVLTISSFQ